MQDRTPNLHLFAPLRRDPARLLSPFCRVLQVNGKLESRIQWPIAPGKMAKRPKTPAARVSATNCAMIFCLEVLNDAMGQTAFRFYGRLRLAAHNQEQAQALAQACEPEPADRRRRWPKVSRSTWQAWEDSRRRTRCRIVAANLGGCGCLRGLNQGRRWTG